MNGSTSLNIMLVTDSDMILERTILSQGSISRTYYLEKLQGKHGMSSDCPKRFDVSRNTIIESESAKGRFYIHLEI